MKSTLKVVLHGLILWALTFIGVMFIIPFRDEERILFESSVSVIFILATILTAWFYYRKVEMNWQNALRTGMVWILICLMLDAPLFGFGPMNLSLAAYIKDIGIMYLGIPIIMVGIAQIVNQQTKLSIPNHD